MENNIKIMGSVKVNGASFRGVVNAGNNIDGCVAERGVAGFSPIANVTSDGDDATITITDYKGTTTATVPQSVQWGNITGDINNQTDLGEALDSKQNVLTAGTGIAIENNIISNTQTSAEWGNITGDINNQTDLQNLLDNKANTDFSNLSATGQAKFDAKVNLDLSNLSETGEKHFLNKTQITNCILEAPNGVGDWLGSNVYIKTGLKVLIPDGKNADGTLKNIEVTLTSDKTETCQYTDGLDIFVNDGAGISANTFNSNQGYYIVDKLSDLPAKSGSYSFCYVIDENKMYRNDGTSTWTAVKCAYIGKVWCDNSLQIYHGKFKEPVNLLTVSDSSQISGWAMPSNRYIDLTLGASGTTYTIPANGWYFLSNTSTSANQYISLVTSNGMGVNKISTGSGQNLQDYIPISKGNIVNVTYNAPTSNAFRFYYAKGEI